MRRRTAHTFRGGAGRRTQCRPNRFVPGFVFRHRIIWEVQLRLVIARSFNQRIDDVCLPACGHLLAHELPNLFSALLAHAARHNGRAARRQLINHAHFQVAIDGERERAWDGRRRHHQHVRIAAAGLLHQREALPYAEAVLLIHDDQAEVGKVDFVLDQRLGADDELGLATQDAAARTALFRGIERAGEQRDLVMARGALQQLAGGKVVLCGQDFRWRHQHGLIAVFDGDQSRLHGDDRLAAPNVTLQEAAHRVGLAHVVHDFAENTLLRRRGTEGQDLLDGGAHVFVRRKGDALAVAQPFALQLQAQLQVEQLFKDEALQRGRAEALQVRHGGARGRKVRFTQRFQSRWQT